MLIVIKFINKIINLLNLLIQKLILPAMIKSRILLVVKLETSIQVLFVIIHIQVKSNHSVYTSEFSTELIIQLKIYAGPRGLIAIVVRMVCRSLWTGRDRKGHELGSSKAERFFQTSIKSTSLSLLYTYTHAHTHTTHSKQDQLLFAL